MFEFVMRATLVFKYGNVDWDEATSVIVRADTKADAEQKATSALGLTADDYFWAFRICAIKEVNDE